MQVLDNISSQIVELYIDCYDEDAILSSDVQKQQTLNVLLWFSWRNVNDRSRRTERRWKHVHPHQQLPLQHDNTLVNAVPLLKA